MLVADDEYILVGSANINQRSMDGQRDTELCVGAFQPHYTTGSHPERDPRGDVYGFRMTLWEEHLGQVRREFQKPESQECMDLVASSDRRKLGRVHRRWCGLMVNVGVDDVVGEMGTDGLCGLKVMWALLCGQVVGKDGSVGSLPGWQHFPDTKAPVLGTPSFALPDSLTG
eukprot:jgi/Botrbrau1/1349/Bobra.0063s0060.1